MSDRDEYVVYVDFGDGLQMFSPHGRSVDVSAESKRWRAFGRKLLRQYLRARRKK